MYRNKSNVVPAILSHLPTHGPNVLVPCPRVRRIYQAPVFDNKIVLWKEKVRPAYLMLEDEPVITHRRSLIVVDNTMIRQIVSNDLLTLTPNMLTRQRDRRYTILLRRLEKITQPGKKAQPWEQLPLTGH